MKNFKLTEEQIKLGIYLALGITALLFIIKFVKKTGETIGVFDTKEEREEEQKTKQAIEGFKKEVQKRGIKKTRTSAQWTFVADSIYNALKYNAAGDDKGKAYTELVRILNDADMAEVLQAFGTRQEYSFAVPIGKPKTLVQFVQDNFSLDDINDINKAYSKSGMRFKF